MADDPFTETLNKLWDLLESHAGFTRLVSLKNRIKLTGRNPVPYRAQAQSADLPEVLIEPAGGEVHLFVTGSSSRAVQDYAIVITTDDLGVSRTLFPLKWELMKALSKSGDSLGLSFVKKVRIKELTERESGRTDRRAAGWSASLVVSVEMWFANAQLQT